jgi:hypothetical protein
MPRRTTTTRPPYTPAEQADNSNDIETTPQLVAPFSNVRTTTPPITTTPAPPVSLISPIAPSGLGFTENLSNGNLSRQVTGAAGINDFSIFNNYIHYVNPGMNVSQFNPQNLLQAAVTRFELYRRQFRI